MIQIKCEKCGAIYNLPDETKSKTGKCKCGETLLIPIIDELKSVKSNEKNVFMELKDGMLYCTLLYFVVSIIGFFLIKIGITSAGIILDVICIGIIIYASTIFINEGKKMIVIGMIITFIILKIISNSLYDHQKNSYESTRSMLQKQIDENNKNIELAQ